MPTTKLTELAVAKVRPPKAGRVEYFDTLLPSFGLRITSNGAKSWVVMTRVAPQAAAGHPRELPGARPRRRA